MIKKQYSKTKPTCKVTFSLTEDQVGKKAEVRVLGTFNDWSWEKGLLLKNKKKTYSASLEVAAGQEYEFRYLVNGHDWVNDEAADDYRQTPFFSHNGVLAIDPVEIKKTAKKTTKAKATPAVKSPKAAKPKRSPKTTAKAAAAPKKAAPTRKKAVAKPDDLKKIEGIGPKIAGLLNEDGIITFKDLATAKLDKVQAVLTAAGPRYRMHNPATWAEQAKLAAAGKWDELKTLQDELKGGRK